MCVSKSRVALMGWVAVFFAAVFMRCVWRSLLCVGWMYELGW